MRAAAIRAVALAAGIVLAAGCSSTVKEGDRIIVEVRADKDLNSAGGTPQPVSFKVVAMKNSVPETDLVQWDVQKLATIGTVVGGDALWIWPEKTVPVTPQAVTEKNQFAFLAIIANFPLAKASIVNLGEPKEGYVLKDGEHRITFTLGKDSIKP